MDYFYQILRFCLINQKTCCLILFMEIIRFIQIHLTHEFYTFRMCLETLLYFVHLPNYRRVLSCLENSLFGLVLNANCRKSLSDFDRIFLNCFFKIGFYLWESARFVAEELQKINQFFIELTYLYYDSALYCLSLVSLFYGFIQKNFEKLIIYLEMVIHILQSNNLKHIKFTFNCFINSLLTFIMCLLLYFFIFYDWTFFIIIFYS